jgi:arginase family enzyme
MTLDRDVLDCAYMPGTSLPEPFGLTGCEVRDFIRGLRGLDLVSADIVEISPPIDPTGASANLGAALLFEMMCVLSEARVSRTSRTRKTHWKTY